MSIFSRLRGLFQPKDNWEAKAAKVEEMLHQEGAEDVTKIQKVVREKSLFVLPSAWLRKRLRGIFKGNEAPDLLQMDDAEYDGKTGIARTSGGAFRAFTVNPTTGEKRPLQTKQGGTTANAKKPNMGIGSDKVFRPKKEL